MMMMTLILFYFHTFNTMCFVCGIAGVIALLKENEPEVKVSLVLQVICVAFKC